MCEAILKKLNMKNSAYKALDKEPVELLLISQSMSYLCFMVLKTDFAIARFHT